MCCVTRSALCWTSIASWNLSKAICAHIFMCFSICNCSLMRLIRLHGMLKMRSRNAASGDQPALHVGIILDVLQYHSRYNHRSPIYDMHPMFSHQRDGWQLQTRFGDVGGDWFPACSALPSLDDDQDEVLMQSVLDHDTQLTCLWNIHEQCWKLVQVKIPVYFSTGASLNEEVTKGWGCVSAVQQSVRVEGVFVEPENKRTALSGADECLFSLELLVIKSRETVLLWGQLLCSPFLSNQWTPPPHHSSSSLLQQDRFLIIASPSSLCMEG